MEEQIQFRSSVQVAVNDDPPAVQVDGEGFYASRFTGKTAVILAGLICEGCFSRNEIIRVAEERHGVIPFSTMMFLADLDKINALQVCMSFEDPELTFVVDETKCSDQLNGKPEDDSTLYVASRFHLTRFDGHEWIVESAHGDGRIRSRTPQPLNLLGLFSEPRSLQSVVDTHSGSVREWSRSLCQALVSVRILVQPESEEQAALRLWDFHDLLFQSRSRIGRTINPGLRLFRFKEDPGIPPLPKERPFEGTRMPLCRDDTCSHEASRPLRQVMQSRRSATQFPESGLTVEQLGRFLDRCNGNVPVPESAKAVQASNRFLGNGKYDFVKKIYPSAGGIYELELFLVVQQCEGIDSGLYYHDANSHELVLIRSMDASLRHLTELQAVQGSMPGVLIMLASRFGRLSYKYESFAYSLTLRNAGVLTAYLYLIAEDMGLSGCAYGTGNAEWFTRLTNTNWYEYAYVSDFGLGAGNKERE
ncbi:SagB family peptide dehydrogenase [Nitrospina gracilis]|uniref:SagB family peptide dehydrogenase n=1 Tax=Nitrospina gracilis TaxID=35801 RepID=UPI001F024325|nr:SagB family peptide dehydrogenase [Nitrospina gracilis]MCF8721405.1 SagB-type dehydrogenase family enzyme [Nitrospina gracilis Nb-211]